MSRERNNGPCVLVVPGCLLRLWIWFSIACVLAVWLERPVSAFEWRAAFGSSSNEFITLHDQLRKDGFRPVSLDVNGESGKEHVASVWIRDGLTNWEARLGLSVSEYEAVSTNLSRSGYRLLTLDSYAGFPEERYAGIWIADGVTHWVARHRLTEPQYAREFRAFSKAGFRPSWISANGSGSNLLFAGVWVEDDKPASARHNISATELRLACQAREEDGFRPITIAGYGPEAESQFAVAWLLEEQPEWKVFQDQSAAELGQTFGKLTNSGFRPATLVEYGANQRYASIWQKDLVPRVFRGEGKTAESLAPFEKAITNFMQLRQVSRASLAVSRNSRLVFARSYTWAEETATATLPTSLFRIASISKPFTAAAILKLVEASSIELDQRVATILDFSSAADPRMNDVTIRQLLQHRGGWDRNVSFDPMFRDFKISKSLGKQLPTSPQMIIDYMKTQPMDFNPGERYAYSNFGYLLLGRVIETITGKRYEDYVRDALLGPLDIRDMKIGRTAVEEKFPDEVEYDDPLRRIVPTVMGGKNRVPIQYGGWNLNAMDAHGGWLASAVD